MNAMEAIGIAEGFIETDSEERYVEAWQFLLDTGLVWSLQGYFGRTAVSMIEAGQIIVKEVGEDEPAQVIL
jgi:hypothetical protein